MGSSLKERKAYGLLKKMLAGGHMLSWNDCIWKRLVEYGPTSLGDSSSNEERWSAKVKMMPGIKYEYRREGRSTKLYIGLKDEYQTRERKPEVHPPVSSIRTEESFNISELKLSNRCKINPLAAWMASEVQRFHYDNCKVAYQKERTIKAFTVALLKGIDKEVILRFYQGLVLKFHQIATDQDKLFAPTGIAKAIKNLRKGEGASEALERVCRALDAMEANRLLVAKQKSLQQANNEQFEQQPDNHWDGIQKATQKLKEQRENLDWSQAVREPLVW